MSHMLHFASSVPLLPLHTFIALCCNSKSHMNGAAGTFAASQRPFLKSLQNHVRRSSGRSPRELDPCIGELR